MKYNIFNGLIACGAIVALTSCSENSWNNEYLDDFKAPDVYPTVETVSYQFTADDFKTISGLSAALTQAQADGFTKSQLEAWGKLGYFTNDFPANKYLPIYFESSSFPYFAANNGSTVTATYREQAATNPVISAIYKGKVYNVNNENYQSAWNDPDKFAYTFSPMKSPSRSLPTILAGAYPDAAEGDYVLVNYNYSSENPDFSSVTAATPINEVKVRSEYTIKGQISAICNQGYILSDATGSLLVYYGSSFVADDYKVGMEIQVSGNGSQYNGGLQLAPKSGTEVIYSNNPYVYPAPQTMDGALMNTLRDKILANGSKGTMPEYVQFDATVTSTGNYTNFTVEGGETTGSAYQLTKSAQSLFTKDEKVAIKGYILSVNTDRNTKKPTYVNFVVTEVNGKATAPMGDGKPFVPKPSGNQILENALYMFNGSAWSEATTVDLVVSPANLEEMGITQGYISNDNAAYNFPVLLKQLYPYAKVDETKLVAYQSGKSYANCAQFNFNGTEWTKYDNIEEKTSQYAKVNGSWIFNPNVTLVIPDERQTEPGLTFYQIAVDWVKENKGSVYIDRGNSEFYSGCSAFYCNINHDVSQSEKYAPDAWKGVPRDEIVPKMRHNFLYEVIPATMKEYYPNANLIDGYNNPIIYEIDYVTYYGSNAFDGKTGSVKDTVKYEVVGPGEFKLIYSTWLGGEVKDAE